MSIISLLFTAFRLLPRRKNFFIRHTALSDSVYFGARRGAHEDEKFVELVKLLENCSFHIQPGEEGEAEVLQE